MSRPESKDVAEVTHVGQESVPLVVMVPPASGEVVAMLVTVPVPAVWQPPSAPRYLVPVQDVQSVINPAAVLAIGCPLPFVPIAGSEIGIAPPSIWTTVIAQFELVTSPVKVGSCPQPKAPEMSVKAGCAVIGTPRVEIPSIQRWAIGTID
jgi:hypothetical protein